MDFIGKPLAGAMLQYAHVNAIDECTEVRAAIPYAQHGVNDILLFDDCVRRDKKLTFYGRVDGSCPIDLKVLAWFVKWQLRSINVVCRLVPHWLHAKVIWWVGQGAYIGSANLTDRAWFKNFEAGVYITEEELEQFGMTLELESFFNGLEDNSFPLDKEEYDRQVAHEKRREDLMRQLRRLDQDYEDQHWKLKDQTSLISVDARKADERRISAFRAEWAESLQLIRSVGARASLDENRPDWIDPDVPQGVQGDQFLHAYYYQIVRPHLEKDAYLRDFAKNKGNPDAALRAALAWWKSGDYRHGDEEHAVYQRAPLLAKLFAKGRIASLTSDEWVQGLTNIYAFGDHASKIENDYLGLGISPGSDAKGVALAKILDGQHSTTGRFTCREVFDFVIWGPGDVAERIWKASHHPDYKLKHIGANIFGEIVGWARPTEYPPRNSRTSKALRALGNTIQVVS